MPSTSREVMRMARENASQSSTAAPRGMADFFTPEVFKVALNDPVTSGQLRRFCEANACGENFAFLDKVEQYGKVIQQARDLLSEIQATYVSEEAANAVNLPQSISEEVTSAVKVANDHTLPELQNMYLDAQEHVRDLIREDTYPRFVTNQMTAMASQALGNDSRTAYSGLGDCFCLTDPNIADNPIIYASDGFIEVTGYSRHDIVPRNCRFLQGERTECSTVSRLKAKIDNGSESVELLLNYRKDGSPFWNLLHVTPLRDEAGKILFFLGGQIDCSSTIHSNPDVLKVLRYDDQRPSGQILHQATLKEQRSSGSLSHREHFRWSRNLFKSGNSGSTKFQQGAGMEHDMVERIGRMSIEAQMDSFQTAYSKFLVLHVDARTKLNIAFYSEAAVHLLDLSGANEGTAPLKHEEIFKILFDKSPASSATLQSYKKTVTTHIKEGKAVSLSLALLHPDDEKRSETRGHRNHLEKHVMTHWTPCKDENGQPKYVVLLFSDN